MPLSQATPFLSQKISHSQSERPQSSLTMTDFSAGSSLPSEYSLATSPANVAHSFSTSNSEEDLSPKNNAPLNNGATEFDFSPLLTEIGLSTAEIEAILQVPASRNAKDMFLFARLCPHFNGRHHLEDIMYYENMRRSELLVILEKFKEVLFTCQYEDAAVAQLAPYNDHDF